ncbi:MAG: tetratricopeptide repeat protein [Sandaracinus sp.]
MAARLALVLFALLAVPALAAAQAAQPTAAELSEAQRQFELGVADYEAGRLEDALVRLSRAYALSGAPELLYNLGTIHERLRHDDEALDAYEAYLEAVPASPDRAAIEARVRVLAETRAHAAVADATADAPVEVAMPVEAPSPQAIASDASSSDPAPWILTGSGLAVAAAGGALVAVAALDASTVMTTTSYREAQSARDRAPIESGVGLGAIGVGVIMAVAGIAWGVATSSDPRAPSVEVAIGPGSIALRGSF